MIHFRILILKFHFQSKSNARKGTRQSSHANCGDMATDCDRDMKTSRFQSFIHLINLSQSTTFSPGLRLRYHRLTHIVPKNIVRYRSCRHLSVISMTASAAFVPKKLTSLVCPDISLYHSSVRNYKFLCCIYVLRRVCFLSFRLYCILQIRFIER